VDCFPYALWFDCSPFDSEQEELARGAARAVLDRHFGSWNVLAAYEAASATGQLFIGDGKEPPKPVGLWLDAITEAYRSAWAAAGLPPLTAELYRDNPQLEDSCVMVGKWLPGYANEEGGLRFRLFDVWIEWSPLEPFDDALVADRMREDLVVRFGSQLAVLKARLACEAAGGLYAPAPQPAAVTAWRQTVQEALANAVEDVVCYDEEARQRVALHPNQSRCMAEVGRRRPPEFGGPIDADDQLADGRWRGRWLVNLADHPQARNACGVAFEIDESLPALRLQRVPDVEADERLEGAWHVQRPAEVLELLHAQALQLILERRMAGASASA
jgi:hypothetical protein